jgi:CHAD domain-containing protein
MTMAQDSPSADAPLRAVRDALLAQLDTAVKGMRHRVRSDARIHAIRKELKRARASMRLLRSCLGSAEFRRDNALIRDAAKPLTPVRDAKVLLDAYRAVQVRGMPDGGAFGKQLQKLLNKQRRQARLDLRPAELQRSARALSEVRRRAASLSDADFSKAGSGGLKRAYKSGRRALAQAEHEKSDESLHEWRKQTKYFANQLELVLPFDPGRYKKSHDRAKRLAEQLGDDHDLSLLTDQIYRHAKGDHSPSRDDHVQDLVAALARHRKKLQRKAFKLGRRLYGGRARRY